MQDGISIRCSGPKYYSKYTWYHGVCYKPNITVLCTLVV